MKFNIDGLEAFAKALDDAANGELRAEFALWLDAMGLEFLDLIQDEIIRTNTVDTGRLLNSFGKGDKDNVWSISEGKLSLDIGTNVEYASYVNDGHFTIDPSKGLDRRWVPGVWKGKRFEYTPGADTGMLLKFTWIDGTHYWDNAFAIFERMFEKSLERRFQEWLDKTF
ncbi:HK97 gp10 family phage protein [Sporosarcina sp. Marseille-Q4943]|uniref:HK97 gp10 family phage protein n=1 Tax=Sporosarcina sp. Marseille-Q4943 TaxID=2942204 RepID=UPI00208DD2FD|nr:HK97 gp10 family phage protein [Sporosarcina sp. Marseille-Q4943]